MLSFRIKIIVVNLLIITQCNSFMLLTANIADLKKLARHVFSDQVAERMMEFLSIANKRVSSKVSEENEQNVAKVDQPSEGEIETFNKLPKNYSPFVEKFKQQTHKRLPLTSMYLEPQHVTTGNLDNVRNEEYAPNRVDNLENKRNTNIFPINGFNTAENKRNTRDYGVQRPDNVANKIEPKNTAIESAETVEDAKNNNDYSVNSQESVEKTSKKDEFNTRLVRGESTEAAERFDQVLHGVSHNHDTVTESKVNPQKEVVDSKKIKDIIEKMSPAELAQKIKIFKNRQRQTRPTRVLRLRTDSGELADYYEKTQMPNSRAHYAAKQLWEDVLQNNHPQLNYLKYSKPEKEETPKDQIDGKGIHYHDPNLKTNHMVEDRKPKTYHFAPVENNRHKHVSWTPKHNTDKQRPLIKETKNPIVTNLYLQTEQSSPKTHSQNKIHREKHRTQRPMINEMVITQTSRQLPKQTIIEEHITPAARSEELQYKYHPKLKPMTVVKNVENNRVKLADAEHDIIIPTKRTKNNTDDTVIEFKAEFVTERRSNTFEEFDLVSGKSVQTSEISTTTKVTPGWWQKEMTTNTESVSKV